MSYELMNYIIVLISVWVSLFYVCVRANLFGNYKLLYFNTLMHACPATLLSRTLSLQSQQNISPDEL